MSLHRQHAHLDAPVEAVWLLVGSPPRYPEWWPRVVEVQGERFEEGDEYAQVTKGPVKTETTKFLLERRDDLREIRMSCTKTGLYAHWLLTPAQGGTFVEIEMGIDPRNFGTRVFDVATGKRYVRRWSEESLDALRKASAERDATPA